MAKGNRGGKRASGGATINKNYKELDKTLIERANQTSFFYKAGDSINREYQSNVNKIQSMDFTDEEKTVALNKLYNLTNDTLIAQTKSVSPMTSGRAGINPNQVKKTNDILTSKRQILFNYMDDLERKSNANVERKKQQKVFNALKDAMNNGLLKVTIDGKTYTRARKNSRTWNFD